jgi:hypothetical protein
MIVSIIKKYLFFLLTLNIGNIICGNSVNNKSSILININKDKPEMLEIAQIVEDTVSKQRSECNKTATVVQVVSVAAIIYLLYNYTINNDFNNIKSIDDEGIEEAIVINKKMSYHKICFDKIQNKLIESYLGEFLGMIYKEIFFASEASILLNHSVVSEVLKDELKNKFLLSEQAQASLFGETLGLLLSIGDLKTKIKKAIKSAMNVSMTAIALIMASAYGHYRLNSYIKSSVDSNLNSIDALKDRPMSKKITQVVVTTGIDSYVVTPLLCSFAILMVQGIEELLSEDHAAIKKGNLVRLVREIISEDSSLTKKYKDIQDGVKVGIRSIVSLKKIFKNIYTILQ